MSLGVQNKQFRIVMMKYRSVIYERVDILESNVDIPTFQTDELVQFIDDSGRYRGYVDYVRHEITIGSGSINFVTTLACKDSEKE